MTSIHPALLAGLSRLCVKYTTERDSRSDGETPSPRPTDHIRPEVQRIWDESKASRSAADGAGEAGPSNQSAAGDVDLLRVTLELVGRELVVSPLLDGDLVDPEETSERAVFLAQLQDRLDVVLTLYEVVYDSLSHQPQLEPGAAFTPLIEELVELISVETWRELWTYIETRSKRFTGDMPSNRGKALPTLRIVNHFLRVLSRTPEDLAFRGRVHQFASSVFRVADKSAINLRGEYGMLETTWEEPGGEGADEAEGNKDEKEEEVKADVEMEGKGKEGGDANVEAGEAGKVELDKAKDPSEPDSTFYANLWSLQQYFARPPTLDGGPTGSPPITPLESFKAKSDQILPVLFAQTVKERALAGAESKDPSSPSRKRKREGSGQEGGFFHPRYLTGRKLLEYELADIEFRRQILLQYCILFQFLLNLTPTSAMKQALTGGMSRTFVIGDEDQEWVKKKAVQIREELRKMGKDGSRFELGVMSVISREKFYGEWKNDGCQESVFEVAPLDNLPAEEAAELWQRRLAPPPRWPFKVGSRTLSMLWRGGYEGVHQLKARKRTATFASLEEDVRQLKEGEEDDRAMGKEPTEDEAKRATELKTTMTWRALRIASHSNLRIFRALDKSRDATLLVLEAKKAEELKRMARPSGVGVGGTAGVGAGGRTPGSVIGTEEGDVGVATPTPAPGTPTMQEKDRADVAEGAEVAQEKEWVEGKEVEGQVGREEVEGSSGVENGGDEEVPDVIEGTGDVQMS